MRKAGVNFSMEFLPTFIIMLYIEKQKKILDKYFSVFVKIHYFPRNLNTCKSNVNTVGISDVLKHFVVVPSISEKFNQDLLFLAASFSKISDNAQLIEARVYFDNILQFNMYNQIKSYYQNFFVLFAFSFIIRHSFVQFRIKFSSFYLLQDF